MSLSLRFEHPVHGRRKPVPVTLLLSKLGAALVRQRVVPRTPVVFRGSPRAHYPALLLQPAKRGKEGAWFHDKGSVCNLVNSIGDTDAMHRLELQRSKDEQ